MSDNLDEPDYDWVTADGQKLKYSEMETSHIKNCIKMLERQLEARPPEANADNSDSDGAYWAKVSEDRHNEELANSIEKTISELNRELSNRKKVEKL